VILRMPMILSQSAGADFRKGEATFGRLEKVAARVSRLTEPDVPVIEPASFPGDR
jgi:hypothetical protein